MKIRVKTNNLIPNSTNNSHVDNGAVDFDSVEVDEHWEWKQVLILWTKKHFFEVLLLLILRLAHSSAKIHNLVALMLRGNC